MTTHEHERVMGVLRGDPLWDRKNHDSLWSQGWFDGSVGRKSYPSYWDRDGYRTVRVTDPAEVEEYRQGYEVGRQRHYDHT